MPLCRTPTTTTNQRSTRGVPAVLTEDALRTIVYQAISTDPARFAHVHYTAMPADTHRAEGAHRAYLQCLTLTVGGHYPHYPMGHDAPEEVAAWRALHDALGMVISQAARTLDEPDYDAALRAAHAVAAGHVPAPARHTARPTSMQDRVLTALTAVGQQAGCQVSSQPQYANTGRMYFTAAATFTTLVELSYHFDTDRCALHLHGP